MKINTSRYTLVILLIFVVLASGCASETQSNPQDKDIENKQRDKESSSGEAQISLSSLSVPEEVEMGENFTIEATFENKGDESGNFETSVMIREQDEETFDATENKIEGEVDSGEKKTFETSLEASGVSSNIVGLAGTDAESKLRIVPKRIQLGEEYTSSNSIGITVESVQLEDYYTYEDIYGEESIEEPDSGQYVFVNLKTQNQGDTPKSLPNTIDFQLIANNRQYEPISYITNEPVYKGEPYEGGEVQPGIIREGYMMFEVPGDVEKSDISIVWNEVISLSEKSVYWTEQAK